MSVGENIAKLRNENNLSQRQLAERIGVHPSMVAQIERGSKLPTVILAGIIADTLGVKIDALLE